jgi:hypothetical protein
MRLPSCCQGVGIIKVVGAKTDPHTKQADKGPWVDRIFVYIVLVLGGLLVAGASGDLVSAGRYDLLCGPAELAQSVSALGDMVDDHLALQSALAREYGSPHIAQVIQLLAERYDAAHPVALPTPDLTINMPINNHNPLDGVLAGGRALGGFYTQLFNAMPGAVPAGLH